MSMWIKSIAVDLDIPQRKVHRIFKLKLPPKYMYSTINNENGNIFSDDEDDLADAEMDFIQMYSNFTNEEYVSKMKSLEYHD